MSLSQRIEISDFSAGLITDLDSAELPASAASVLTNADVRNKKLETLPGLLAVNTGLNAAFVKITEQQFKFTSPSEQNCVLVYGTLAGVHQLHIRPYISSAGAWVDAWQELTEIEKNLTMDAGTSTTAITDAALLSTVDDYYNGWFVYNTTRTRGAPVIDYNGTTKVLTLAWAVTLQAAGDGYFIARNPIYRTSGVSLFDVDASYAESVIQDGSYGVEFLQGDNTIAIVTGSGQRYDTSATYIKTDLVITVQNAYQAFDDTDLNFTGFQLSPKSPRPLVPDNLYGVVTTYVAIAAGEEALPVPTSAAYIILPVAVYDGYQESALYSGYTPYDGTLYNTSEVFALLAANQKAQVDIDLYYGKSAGSLVPSGVPFLLSQNSAETLVFDRRITAIRLYMAEGTLTANANTPYRPTSEWRLVKELLVNDTAWAGTGPDYTQTVYITGTDWAKNAGVDVTDHQGHASLKIHPNATFIAGAGSRVAVANAYLDVRRQSIVVFSAINRLTQNTPDVLPFTSILDLSIYGIPKIVGFKEAQGVYVAFGENNILRISPTGLSVEENKQARGTSSRNAIVNVNGLLYFANLEDIYLYNSQQNIVRSIATGFVRDAWKALSTANKQAAAIGYDQRFEKLVIAAGTTVYTYNLPAFYASDLASDVQAVGSWELYSVSKTFVRFYTDLIGRCIGIDSAGIAYELFSSGSSNTLVWEKVLGESLIAVEGIRLTYNATGTITVQVFDMAKNATYPVMTYKFPAQSLHREAALYKSCKAKRIKLKLSAPVGTVISQIVVNPSPLSNE